MKVTRNRAIALAVGIGMFLVALGVALAVSWVQGTRNVPATLNLQSTVVKSGDQLFDLWFDAEMTRPVEQITWFAVRTQPVEGLREILRVSPRRVFIHNKSDYFLRPIAPCSNFQIAGRDAHVNAGLNTMPAPGKEPEGRGDACQEDWPPGWRLAPGEKWEMHLRLDFDRTLAPDDYNFEVVVGVLGAKADGQSGSPGPRIAFLSDRTGNWKLYAMNGDGTELTLLTKPNAFPDWEGFASRFWPIGWSPDASEIAFVSSLNGTWGIFVVSSDGSTVRRLTDTQLRPGNPRWSPDGTKIVFDQLLPTGDDIFVVDADGSLPVVPPFPLPPRTPHLVQLTATNDISEDEPVWSPDGTKIAFRRRLHDSTSKDEVFVMNSDGSGLMRISNVSGAAFRPAWSPGGDKIAFIGDTPARCIVVVNADGSGQTCVALGVALAWSPDGTEIAFHSSKDGSGSIYTIKPDGANEQRLTNSFPFPDSNPAWSPDGAKIAFVSGRDGNGQANSEIYVMDADGKHQFRLTNNPATDLMPTWSSAPTD